MSIDFQSAPIASVVTALMQSLSALPEDQHSFARSLLDAAGSRRGCSPKQAHWLRRLAQRAAAPPAIRVKVNLAGVLAMFEKAGEQLKQPRIWIAAGKLGKLRLSRPGPMARHPNSINVTGPGAFEDRKWFGRILPDGAFLASKDASAVDVACIETALAELAADPVKVAAQYGHDTGSCCFCSIALTDGRSIKVGYGPICAKNYGLPWGA